MRKVEVTIPIQTKPETVISAFTEPEMLREWWGVERSLIENKVGGVYTIAWSISSNGFGYVSTGVISEYDPQHTLVISNFVYLNPEKPFLGPMSLTIKSKATASGAELYLCQDGYRDGGEWDWYYDAVKNAWPVVVDNLKKYLESH